MLVSRIDDRGVDDGEQGEAETRPNRPEVAVCRDRPDGDEEAEDQDGDPDLDRKRLTAACKPSGDGVFEDEDDPARDPDHEREREQRPERPEVPAPGQGPDDHEGDNEAGRDQSEDRQRAEAARSLLSAGDLTTPSASPASKRVASRREIDDRGPRRWTMSTSRASPAAAKGSVSASVSTFERPKTSELSAQRYQIGSESSWSAKPTTDSTTSAIGQASRRCACCFQNAGSLRTLKPRLQKPVPVVRAAGPVWVLRRSRATLA